MTIQSLIAVQTSRSRLELQWLSDSTPAAGYEVERESTSTPLSTLAVLAGAATTYVDASVGELPLGDIVTYHVTDLDLATGLVAAPVTLVDPESPYTYGPVNPLPGDAPRYTTVALVKQRVGIPAADTTKDDLILQSCIAAEVGIDQANGRSLPDTGDNPEIPGIPYGIRNWALDAAIAIYKRADAPFGTGGSDEWLGTIDVADDVERALRRNPLALGYKVSFGVGSAS